jgi:hypothetical protein
MSRIDQSFASQNHDRITTNAEDAFVGATMMSSQSDAIDYGEVTVAQKMLSAISGSVMTSLLGK